MTAPLRLPAHLVYARLLLGHLRRSGRGARELGRRAVARRARSCARNRCATAATNACSRATKRRSPRSSPRGRARCGRAPRSTTIRPRLRRVRSTGSSSTRSPASRAAAMFWRNAVTWGGDADLIDELRAIEAAGDDERCDVGAAPDRVDQAPRVMPGFLQDFGGHAELAPRAVRDALARRIRLRNLHEFLLEPAEVGAAALHAGQLDFEVAALLEQRQPGRARSRSSAPARPSSSRFFTESAVRLRPRFGLFASSASR